MADRRVPRGAKRLESGLNGGAGAGEETGLDQAGTAESSNQARRGWAIALDRAILKLAVHWLALLNLFWGLYVGLPVLAPLLMKAGLALPAKVIYTLYRPACHQRPERSYFVGGPQAVYSLEELAAAGVDTDPLARDIGNDAIGWKVAFCQRDVATYGAVFLSGLAYALVRHKRRGWLLRARFYLLFLLPIGIDGTLQLIGLYQSNWIVRTVTGSLFGFGSVLFAYPYLEDAFADVRRSLTRDVAPK